MFKKCIQLKSAFVLTLKLCKKVNFKTTIQRGANPFIVNNLINLGYNHTIV